MSLSQKEAVFKAVTAHKHDDGSFDRKAVIEELGKMFRAGEFVHGNPDTLREDKALRDYCGQMLSNWLRKDERLGGTEPSASRVGRKKQRPADDELKRLIAAKVVLTTEGKSTDEIDSLIEQRTKELEGEKTAAAERDAADAESLLNAMTQL